MTVCASGREDNNHKNLKWNYGGTVRWQNDSALDSEQSVRPPPVVWNGE